MRYYDADSDAICLILDEMAELLTGDQAIIFDALRAGVPRQEIAADFGLSMTTLRKRISRIYQRIREGYRELDLPRLYNLNDLF